jgi:hypothetical protein
MSEYTIKFIEPKKLNLEKKNRKVFKNYRAERAKLENVLFAKPLIKSNSKDFLSSNNSIINFDIELEKQCEQGKINDIRKAKTIKKPRLSEEKKKQLLQINEKKYQAYEASTRQNSKHYINSNKVSKF